MTETYDSNHLRLKVDPRGVIPANSKLRCLKRKANTEAYAKSKKVMFEQEQDNDAGVDAGDPLFSFNSIGMEHGIHAHPLDYCTGIMNNFELEESALKKAVRSYDTLLSRLLQSRTPIPFRHTSHINLANFIKMRDEPLSGVSMPNVFHIIFHIATFHFSGTFRGLARSSAVDSAQRRATAQPLAIAIAERGKMSTWNNGSTPLLFNDRVYVTVPPYNELKKKGFVNNPKNNTSPHKREPKYISEIELAKILYKSVCEILEFEQALTPFPTGSSENEANEEGIQKLIEFCGVDKADPAKSIVEEYSTYQCTEAVDKHFRPAYVGVNVSPAYAGPGDPWAVMRQIV